MSGLEGLLSGTGVGVVVGFAARHFGPQVIAWIQGKMGTAQAPEQPVKPPK